jgi:hypothetical protein
MIPLDRLSKETEIFSALWQPKDCQSSCLTVSCFGCLGTGVLKAAAQNRTVSVTALGWIQFIRNTLLSKKEKVAYDLNNRCMCVYGMVQD